MLYATTRNERETYTAQRALRENRAPDGGLFVPYRLPRLAAEDIAGLGERSFNGAVATVLNLLFGVRLTGYDVGFSIGRNTVRLKGLGHRATVAECWHNLESEFPRIVRNLTGLLSNGQAVPGDWANVGIRIAVLFGIFSELTRSGIAGPDKKVDIALVSGDFSGPMSAWYARKMGLPIGNIICCCNDNGNLWDFISHGQLRTDGIAVVTDTPEADVVVPTGLERLIYAAGGTGEVAEYLDAVRRGGSYFAEGSVHQALRQGLHATVTSRRRVLETIPRVYGTHAYIPSPYTALAYAGLQDYRVRTGESRWALILGEKSPEKDLDTVADALGITPEELKNHLDRN